MFSECARLSTNRNYWLMQMLGNFGAKTKLTFYIFCPTPLPQVLRCSTVSLALQLCIFVFLHYFRVMFFTMLNKLLPLDGVSQFNDNSPAFCRYISVSDLTSYRAQPISRLARRSFLHFILAMILDKS